jgi:solute carrier family 45 protein 1/2/4
VSKSENGDGLSAQAGAIIGIHNLFIVIPQFLVTGLSSILFALLDPDKSVLHGRHPGSTPPQPGDGTLASTLAAREDGAQARGTDSIAIIFRVGGIAAAIACVLCYRLAKELKRR